MLPQPLHPAVVHFPIVLMVFLPLVTAVILWRLHDGAHPKTWRLVLVIALLLTASSWVATRTGENEEDTVERVVAEEPIHEHEEAAEAFMLASWFVLALAAAGALPGRLGRVGRVATLLASLVLAFLGWRVGDLGGKLAYQEGAAAAYANQVRSVQVGSHDDDGDQH
jgi:uncharacterized membrane protein